MRDGGTSDSLHRSIARDARRLTPAFASAVVTELPEPAAPLGRVVATERRPNTPHEFHFWTALSSPVGIGTIVRVDGRPTDGLIPHIYGIVVEGFSYTDLMSPLHDVIGHDGTPQSAG
jgi:hypothetical protein